MPGIRAYEIATPSQPPSGGYVLLYPKADGRWYFMASNGVEIPLKPVGAGTGDLLSDGSVPLTSDWDVGSFKIIARQLESDVPTGTPPLIVASTTLVANLNADQLDGQEGSYYASVAYVDSSVVGLFEDKGNYDASTNTPDLDTAPSGIKKGDVYTVSVAGQFFTEDVEIGDVLRALQDDPTTLAHWARVQTNLTPASIKTQYESNADTNAFTDAEKTKLASGVVEKATFDANTILAANSDDTPAAVTVGEDTLVGRLAGGNIGALSVSQVQALLGILSASNNVQTGTTYTIQASDNGKNIIFTNAAAIAVTLPDTLALDFQCSIVQAGTGVPTVTPNTDTVNGGGTGVAPSGQWKAMYLTQFQATEWLAVN